MRFKRGLLLVLLLLGCLCVPAGAFSKEDISEDCFRILSELPDGCHQQSSYGREFVFNSFSSSKPISSFEILRSTSGPFTYQLANLDVKTFSHDDRTYYLLPKEYRTDFKLKFSPSCSVTVYFYEPPEDRPDPVTMISTLPKELLSDTIHLDFSKSITDFKCSLIDASGASIGLTTTVNGSMGTVQITDKAFKAGDAYTLNVTSATAEDGGTLDKSYTHTFEAVPVGKLLLKSSLPEYLIKNSISLEFSSPVKDLSVKLLDASGQEVATQVAISGSSATVQIIDTAFQSGQPYTFNLLGATAEDGGKLENPISHSFKEMISSGNQGFDMVFMGILSMFTESKTQGLIIVILAVFVGLIFVLGRWLWAMSKVWLRRAKY